ncbi:MAG: adenylate cyclase, partial [candidate division NC10 bacterium]
EMWEKAVRYLRQAGAKAFARSANREAVAYFEQALAALRHLPETRETLEQAIDLRFDLRTSLFPLGELERIFGYLREAEGLARTLDDQRRLGWVSVYIGHLFWMTGHSADARTSAESAQAIAETLRDFQLQVGANFYVGTVCLTSGEYGQAESFLRKVVQLLEGDRYRDRCGLAGFPAAMARGYLAWALAERGAFEEGIVHGQEGIRIAEALEHPYSWVVASWGAGYLYRTKGELTHAVRLLERALALCREWNLPTLLPITVGFLGPLYALSGRVAEGLSLLDQGVNALESIQSLIVAQFGEACILADRLEDALALAERALALARERGQRGYEAWALRLLGEIAPRRDPPDVETAEGHYRQAMALAEELGMRPLIAHCHLGLGKLSRRTVDRSKIEEHLTTAMTLYREMDMGFWLAQAEAELAVLG